MTTSEPDASMHGLGRIRTLADRMLGLADEPTDDDDIRLRKRVGVLAGYVLVVLPLQLPFLGPGVATGWFVAVAIRRDRA